MMEKMMYFSTSKKKGKTNSHSNLKYICRSENQTFYRISCQCFLKHIFITIIEYCEIDQHGNAKDQVNVIPTLILTSILCSKAYKCDNSISSNEIHNPVAMKFFKGTSKRVIGIAILFLFISRVLSNHLLSHLTFLRAKI